MPYMCTYLLCMCSFQSRAKQAAAPGLASCNNACLDLQDIRCGDRSSAGHAPRHRRISRSAPLLSGANLSSLLRANNCECRIACIMQSGANQHKQQTAW